MMADESVSLRNLAIELINEAKSCTEAKKRLYYLEQLREVLINRDRLIITNRLNYLQLRIGVIIMIYLSSTVQMVSWKEYSICFQIPLLRWLSKDFSYTLPKILLKPIRRTVYPN